MSEPEKVTDDGWAAFIAHVCGIPKAVAQPSVPVEPQEPKMTESEYEAHCAWLFCEDIAPGELFEREDEQDK